MDGKKSISNLFSYASGNSKNLLTESESRKHSICTIYNGKNCLTPCYEYPYYTSNIQSYGVIEEHLKGASNGLNKYPSQSSIDTKKPKKSLLYINSSSIGKFFENQFNTKLFFMD
ncbi:Hypothetical protein SRAE_1000332700 [Strongyloides ratti]|uniref:Uncharacterized protein n=1 Tax=Strongyloides ratti TaxID=34506 RepID=A0A090MXA1_STRRB|nr:Hypothetical protein SRAE_1000332700 [Strongyloides ratti]CEF65074.1 Hypothetical protein SRAE_1000332700 [Strongyloides ratti]